MKKTIFGLICICVACSAYGQTMCKRKNTHIASISKSINGTSAAVVDAGLKQWSATFANYTITGNAACTEVPGTVNGVNTALYATSGDIGPYCWCQMQTPMSSYWVMLSTYADETACASGCTLACGTAIQSNVTYRTAALESVW